MCSTETKSYRLYSSQAEISSPQKWAEIDLSALRFNYSALRARLRERAPRARMIAVVKADAYGHGAPACVRTLLLEGCDFFAVSCIEEAIPIRKICDEMGSFADVLIFGYTEPSMAETLCAYRLTQTLLSPEYASRLASEAEMRGVTVSSHVAIDTGMNRIGFPAYNEDEICASVEQLLYIGECRGLKITGMMTHFAQADEMDAVGTRTTRLQTERYLHFRECLERKGMFIPFHHISNSAAFAGGEVPILDGVRIGISLYGAQPSLQKEMHLVPVMWLKAKISHIHTLLPGECVGYGGEFSAETERKIAVLSIGYADGFLRAYSGAEVVVHTVTGAYRSPIVGRVCMDQCMIDITDTDAAVGDVATLFGGDGVFANALAEYSGSIDYETLCLISSRVMRCYKE